MTKFDNLEPTFRDFGGNIYLIWWLFLINSTILGQIWRLNLVEFKFRDQIQPQIRNSNSTFFSNSELFQIEYKIRPSLIQIARSKNNIWGRPCKIQITWLLLHNYSYSQTLLSLWYSLVHQFRFEGSKLIIFKSILTTFIVRVVLRGHSGNGENWHVLKIEPPQASTACLNRWNTLYLIQTEFV